MTVVIQDVSTLHLLHAAAILGRSVQSLRGPSRAAKYVQVGEEWICTQDPVELIEALNVASIAKNVALEALQSQDAVVGAGCTTLAVLIGQLSGSAAALLEEGISRHTIVVGLQRASSVCRQVCEAIALPVDSVKGTRDDGVQETSKSLSSHEPVDAADDDVSWFLEPSADGDSLPVAEAVEKKEEEEATIASRGREQLLQTFRWLVSGLDHPGSFRSNGACEDTEEEVELAWLPCLAFEAFLMATADLVDLEHYDASSIHIKVLPGPPLLAVADRLQIERSARVFQGTLLSLSADEARLTRDAIRQCRLKRDAYIEDLSDESRGRGTSSKLLRTSLSCDCRQIALVDGDVPGPSTRSKPTSVREMTRSLLEKVMSCNVDLIIASGSCSDDFLEMSKEAGLVVIAGANPSQLVLLARVSNACILDDIEHVSPKLVGSPSRVSFMETQTHPEDWSAVRTASTYRFNPISYYVVVDIDDHDSNRHHSTPCTIVAFSPVNDNRTQIERRFRRYLARLHDAFSESRVLPGAGTVERICSAVLEQVSCLYHDSPEAMVMQRFAEALRLLTMTISPDGRDRFVVGQPQHQNPPELIRMRQMVEESFRASGAQVRDLLLARLVSMEAEALTTNPVHRIVGRQFPKEPHAIRDYVCLDSFKAWYDGFRRAVDAVELLLRCDQTVQNMQIAGEAPKAYL